MNPFSVVFASRYLPEEDPRCGKDLREEAADVKENFLSFCLDNHSPPEIPFHYVNFFFNITKKETSGKWIFETNTFETHYLSLAYFGAEAVAWLIKGFPDWKRTSKDFLFLPIHLHVSTHLEYTIEVIAITYHGKDCTHTSQQKLEIPRLVYYDSCEIKTETDPMLWC